MTADPRAALEAGLTGRYAIERELGRGGMATVYLARDLRHDRPVALKVLHPDLAATLGIERFQREIKLAARLQHPHILTVLDSGDAGGRLWFTMPFVEGESLRDRLKRERQLAVDDALRITGEAAQALHYAHEHGVIHRDIKPENLLLTRDGNTLVADFGIARALGTGPTAERLTETGLAIGTPEYMSPEQAAGDHALDARTDVYSLAAVLYEMLAGEPPHSGATTRASMVKRLTEAAPSIRAVRPSVPPHVDTALTKALAPVAADRFASTAELARAIRPASRSPELEAPTAPSAAARVPPRRIPVGASALILGILIGVGVLFAWRRSGSPAADGSAPRVLAVLPFENLGDSADAYFADGVTDEIRTKLAQVRGLEVIARGSSNEYRGTPKRAQEIAHELGAGYLLTGTVRWIKTADGASQVRVAPELVEVVPGRTPRTRWGEQFDAGLTDVFEVQGEIAGKVVSALDVALADSARTQLVAKPTESVAAYDALLKGDAAANLGSPADQRRAVGFYRESIRLDSSFALAWARLARTAAFLYVNAGSTPENAALSRNAAERARQLAPNHPETYIALAFAEGNVGGNPQRAREITEAGLRIAPNNADLLATAAALEQTLGRFDQVVALLERGFAIDPRSAVISRRLGYALTVLKRYPEAKTALERGLTLSPGNVGIQQNMALAALGQGELATVRRIGEQPSGVSRDQMIAYLAQYDELGWALDERQQARLLELGPELFDGDRAAWAIARAQVYAIRGDRARLRIWADTARIEFEQQLSAAPDDPQRLAIYGVALAHLGRHAEAARAGKRALELLPPSRDMYFGPYVQHQLVRVHILAGNYDAALDQLEPLLELPYTLTPAWLRLDPTFAPLRDHPRFKKLVTTRA